MVMETSILRRLRQSDSLTLNCQCPRSGGGTVVLFYGYGPIEQPQVIADLERKVLELLQITGKVRISTEGFNITLAGTNQAVLQYISLWGHRLAKTATIQPQSFVYQFQQAHPDCELTLNFIDLVAPSPYHLLKDVTSNISPDKNILDTDLPKLWLEKDILSQDFTTSAAEFWTPLKVRFFKPSPGCVHVFDGLSVKVVEEICPLGVPNNTWQPELGWTTYNPLLDEKTNTATSENSETSSLNNSDTSIFLRYKVTPEEFDHLIEDNLRTSSANSEAVNDDYLVLDVRNYYESELGKFKGAICPPIRNFKALPNYCQDNLSMFADKKIVTYCTGGIRCEKATAFIRDFIQPKLIEKEMKPIKSVFMLEGGIHNYLAWCNESGKPNSACNFLGRNYVFDARQSMSLNDSSAHTLSNDSTLEQSCITKCGHCNAPSGYLYKCESPLCHKIVIRCPPINNESNIPEDSPCYASLPNCCMNCKSLSILPASSKRGLCECERQRLDLLKTKKCTA